MIDEGGKKIDAWTGSHDFIYTYMYTYAYASVCAKNQEYICMRMCVAETRDEESHSIRIVMQKFAGR